MSNSAFNTEIQTYYTRVKTFIENYKSQIIEKEEKILDSLTKLPELLASYKKTIDILIPYFTNLQCEQLDGTNKPVLLNFVNDQHVSSLNVLYYYIYNENIYTGENEATSDKLNVKIKNILK